MQHRNAINAKRLRRLKTRASLCLCAFVVSMSAPMPGAQQACAQTRPALPVYLAYGYDAKVYALDPGPHLFIDWRYLQAGRTRYHFPDGKEAPREGGDPE